MGASLYVQLTGKFKRLIQWGQAEAGVSQPLQKQGRSCRRVSVPDFDDLCWIINAFAFWSQRREGYHRQQFAHGIGHFNCPGIRKFVRDFGCRSGFQSACNRRSKC